VHDILIVESDDHSLRTRGDELLLDGYEVHAAQTAQQTRAKLTTVSPDALILGTLEQPPEALALLRELRSGQIPHADSRLPVISIGADTDHAATRHYQAGADLVLANEPSPLLVSGALSALAARVGTEATRRALVRIGSIAIDSGARTVSVDGAEMTLTRLEFDLLEALARDPHTVLTRKQLAQNVWNTEYVAGRTIDSHAARLRTKLSAAGATPALQTVRGVGYRLGG